MNLARALLVAGVAALGPAPSAPNVAATAPSAVATVSKSEVSVGEPFAVEVRVTGPRGCEFSFPGEALQEAFELRPAPPEKTPLPEGTRRYIAEVFAVGDAEVPPIPVGYRLADGTTGEIRTLGVPLRVVSLLPRERDEQKLADVRGPVALGIGRAFWIALGVLALLVAAGIAWLILRRRRRAPAMVVAVPALEPDAEARQALDALVASGRLARHEYRPFYIDLAGIAKRYLERRLDAPIVEMTSAEMLSHLRATPHGAELAPTMRDLAGAADQIKFARGAGVIEEAERHLGSVRAMVETLEVRMRPSPAPAQGGQAA